MQICGAQSDAIKTAVRILQRGGVIVYPTETSYGVGVDGTNKKAIARLYTLKGRVKSQPLSILVSSQRMLKKYARLTSGARTLWQHLPGPLTLRLPARDAAKYVADAENAVGIRVSSHPFVRALIRAYGKPITATSANVSGRPSLYSADDIEKVFRRRKHKPDLLIDAGVLPKNSASTVVDCTGKTMRVLRQGDIKLRL
jgi:L-threonylcarbamoyladenylate synthase